MRINNSVNFTVFNVEIVPIMCPTQVIEEATHLTVVGGVAYFFNNNSEEVYRSRKLKIAYEYESTIIMLTDRGELYHLINLDSRNREKEEKTFQLRLKQKAVEVKEDDEEIL